MAPPRDAQKFAIAIWPCWNCCCTAVLSLVSTFGFMKAMSLFIISSVLTPASPLTAGCPSARNSVPPWPRNRLTKSSPRFQPVFQVAPIG